MKSSSLWNDFIKENKLLFVVFIMSFKVVFKFVFYIVFGIGYVFW